VRNQTSGNLALAGFNDIFNVGTSSGERITEIALSELYPPEFHPFQVNDDEAMRNLVESVKQYGVREPGLVRVRAEGAGTSGASYELLSGNRRKRACELAGIATLPVIIRELSDDDAAIAMVDSNLQQREKLLFSERAWAYRVKMEALNHSGVKAEMHSADVLVTQTGESRNQIFRLIRLTELVPDLLDKVDTRQLAFNPAVELSYLSRTEQAAVVAAMAKHEIKPSLSQAVRLKKLKQNGTLTPELIDGVLAENKKPSQGEPTGAMKFRKFFPPDYSPKQIETVIFGLLRDWKAQHGQ
jgi:ParB family chromosome partitioning protein